LCIKGRERTNPKSEGSPDNPNKNPTPPVGGSVTKVTAPGGGREILKSYNTRGEEMKQHPVFRGKDFPVWSVNRRNLLLEGKSATILPWRKAEGCTLDLAL